MTVTIKGVEKELEFTFNSFKKMGNFDLKVLNTIQDKPFAIIEVAEQLLHGAVNNDPKVYYSESDVDEFLDEYINEGKSLSELVETLISLMQESKFFKSLQKTPQPKIRK